jgi:hypothetical protein
MSKIVIDEEGGSTDIDDLLISPGGLKNSLNTRSAMFGSTGSLVSRNTPSSLAK